MHCAHLKLRKWHETSLRRSDVSGFVERVIDDWLTKCDERAYQLPFAAWLARQGYSIKFVSRHGAGEHGKDIVAVDPRGVVCAYQLKKGSIGTGDWRSIEGEVREASTIPVSVPGMRQKVPGRAFVVLTGQISDPVREKLGLINADLSERGYAPIETIELPELIGEFTSAFESFIPSALGPVAELMRVYFQDGAALADKAIVSEIFESMLPQSKPSRTTVQRAFSNVVVAGQFMSTPFVSKANHVAVLELWTMASVAILMTLKRFNLDHRNGESALNLCWQAMDDAQRSLIAECHERKDFIEGIVLFDSPFVPFRKLLVLGFVGAAINSRAIQTEDVTDLSVWLRDRVFEEVPLNPWGEGTWPYYLNIACAVATSSHGALLGEALVANWLQYVCPRRGPGPQDPYWTIADEVKAQFAPERKDLFERTPSSFTVEAALQYLVRRLRRSTIKDLWWRISRFVWTEFVPSEPWMSFRWHNEQGRNEVQPVWRASWASLRRKSFLRRTLLFEDADAWLLPYFLCVFPHRTTTARVTELESRLRPEFANSWQEAGPTP
jgi:hypothetical protein